MDYNMIGCSSHMCLIKKPKGVGTNGPCLCKAHKLKLKLTWQDVRIKQLEDELKELDPGVAYQRWMEAIAKCNVLDEQVKQLKAEKNKLELEIKGLLGQCDSSDQ